MPLSDLDIAVAQICAVFVSTRLHVDNYLTLLGTCCIQTVLPVSVLLEEEEEEEFYMLRPVNKTDHMQQGMNVLA